MWVATQDLARSADHPFYTRLNQILDEHKFDEYVEGGEPYARGATPVDAEGCCESFDGETR